VWASEKGVSRVLVGRRNADVLLEGELVVEEMRTWSGL
jgi:hypothetical protein